MNHVLLFGDYGKTSETGSGKNIEIIETLMFKGKKEKLTISKKNIEAYVDFKFVHLFLVLFVRAICTLCTRFVYKVQRHLPIRC